MTSDTIHQALISHTSEHAFEKCSFPILNRSRVVYTYTITYWGDPAQLNYIVR